jgi:hypothetical protein
MKPLVPPPAGRPAFPTDYGIERAADGLLSWDWLAERFAAARNYWVVTTRPDGRPHAMPVWGVWIDNHLVFSTAPGSVKGRNLRARRDVVVHTESGDELALIEGVADDLALDDLPSASALYHAKYGLAIPEPGPESMVVEVAPVRALAWREADFPHSATRWVFGG